MSYTLHKKISYPFIKSSGLKEGIMRPRGLSFPLADHMSRLLSRGIRSHLRPLGLLESHSSLVCVEVRRLDCLSVSLVHVKKKLKTQCQNSVYWNKNWLGVSCCLKCLFFLFTSKGKMEYGTEWWIRPTVKQGINLTLSIVVEGGICTPTWPLDLLGNSFWKGLPWPYEPKVWVRLKTN